MVVESTSLSSSNLCHRHQICVILVKSALSSSSNPHHGGCRIPLIIIETASWLLICILIIDSASWLLIRILVESTSWLSIRILVVETGSWLSNPPHHRRNHIVVVESASSSSKPHRGYQIHVVVVESALWLSIRCQCEYSFTWVSPNQYIIGLFQLFVGRLLNSSYPIFE